MTCHTCGNRCSDRWCHPQLIEDYYCASCYVQMIDEEVEEFLAERQDAVKAIRGKNCVKETEWVLLDKGVEFLMRKPVKSLKVER